MALIKCPECGKEVSDTCDRCIHCGYVFKPAKNEIHQSSSPSKAEKIAIRNNKERIYAGLFLSILLLLGGGILALMHVANHLYTSYLPYSIGAIILGLFGLIYNIVRLNKDKN